MVPSIAAGVVPESICVTSGGLIIAARKPLFYTGLTEVHQNYISLCVMNLSSTLLRKEFYRAIPVDQLKSVVHSCECSRRCRQGLVNRAVTTFMRIVRLSPSIHFP